MFEGRRGYTVVEGRDIRDGTAGEAVIERGVAREWDVHVGDEIYVERLGALRVSGIAVSPDNVAYPLASAARVYVTRAEHRGRVRPNVALLWLADPEKADVTLAQARAVTFGLGKLQFITRTGVEILLSQAAGIVISLLVAFSFVALLAAGTMLAAGAHADVQRRLTGLGVQRALGFGPGRIAAQQAVESALVAIPAALAGITLGAVLVARPAAELLAALNELGPGLTGMLLPLALSTAARGRAGRRRRDVAGLARRAPPARGDPARRRPVAQDQARAPPAAGCSPSACGSPPRRGGAGSRPSRRSPCARAWSRSCSRSRPCSSGSARTRARSASATSSRCSSTRS